MAPRLVLAASIALLLSICVSMTTSQSQNCDTISWEAQHGSNPILPHRGKVVLVTLVKGYCGYCIDQARRTQEMYTRLTQSAGMPDLEMILVNGGEAASSSQVDRVRNVTTLQVLQDTPSNYLYSRVFQGMKDDSVIYDRCGQRSFYVPFPYSNLRHNITERLLRRTYAGNHHCHCNRDPRSTARTRIN